jgi:hypothetical protein
LSLDRISNCVRASENVLFKQRRRGKNRHAEKENNRIACSFKRFDFVEIKNIKIMEKIFYFFPKKRHFWVCRAPSKEFAAEFSTTSGDSIGRAAGLSGVRNIRFCETRLRRPSVCIA